MSAPELAPYDGLSPDRILDALESVGIRGDGVPQIAMLGPAQAPERLGHAFMPVVNA